MAHGIGTREVGNGNSIVPASQARTYGASMITIIYTEYGPTIEWSELDYMLGDLPPRYPVPALIGIAFIEPGFAGMYGADNEEVSPLITWYNEAWGYKIPCDHGRADYTFSN